MQADSIAAVRQPSPATTIQTIRERLFRSRARQLFRSLARRCIDPIGIPLLRLAMRSTLAPGIKRWIWQQVGPAIARGRHRYFVKSDFDARFFGNTMDGMQRYIYFFGLWEPNLTAWISGRLQPGDTFIDVGANIGYYSVLASKLVGANGNIVAIEASPTIFRDLQKHLAVNKATNVRAVNVAAADCEGSVAVYKAPPNRTGQTSVLEQHGFSLEATVPSAPLGTILSAEEIESARVVKIDVEGAEWSVAAGLTLIFDRMRHDVEIVVEIAPDRLAQSGRTAQDVVEHFATAGFHAYALENSYDAVSYLPPRQLRRPVRMHEPIRAQVDVVFSRKDVASL